MLIRWGNSMKTVIKIVIDRIETLQNSTSFIKKLGATDSNESVKENNIRLNELQKLLVSLNKIS